MSFISTVSLIKLVHSLLRLEFFVQMATFVLEYFAVHVLNRHARTAGVHFAPNSYFNSTEYLLDSLRNPF